MDKHKVFISYYHKEDQEYKNYLERMNYYGDLFINMSVRNGDIDDQGMTSEQIRVKIRDEYIKDSTVLVLLCGRNTKGRKHVDWEIHASMYDTVKNPKMGILIINLPGSNNVIRRGSQREGQLISSNTNWYSVKTREEYHEKYPDMPERLIDNFLQDEVSFTVVEWAKIENNAIVLKELIHHAYSRRKTQNYDTARLLRRSNSPLR